MPQDAVSLQRAEGHYAHAGASVSDIETPPVVFIQFLVTQMKIKILSALVLALTLNSCADDTVVDPPNTTKQPTTEYGQSIKVGNDSARTYVTLDTNGNPMAIGIAIDEEAIDGNGNTMSMTTLPLPNAANSKLPFKHVSMDWNPQGHEPLMFFSDPHFDFHFYTITESEMHSIAVDDKMYKAPNLSDIPAGYTGYADIPGVGRTAIGGIAMMGWHMSDSTVPMIPGQYVFDHIFIYGFYNAKMNFMEPMITKDFLETKTTVTADIKQPQTYLNSGNYWPTKYTIRYDATAKQYIVEMHGMVLRN
jgi:hypothetical protein